VAAYIEQESAKWAKSTRVSTGSPAKKKKEKGALKSGHGQQVVAVRLFTCGI
jgi:hypothetical protein